MEGGKEPNYWPGFVDALSNVVLTLVFVLVIFVFALVIASSKVEEKAQQVSQREKVQQEQLASAGCPPSSTDLMEENDKLRQQVAELSAQNPSKMPQPLPSAVASEDKNTGVNLAIEDKAVEGGKHGDLTLVQNGNGLVVKFPLQVVDIDEKNQAALDALFVKLQQAAGPHHVLIRSVVGKEPYSEAQRLAYYRAVNLRNMLIKLGEPPDNISTVIDAPPQPDDGHADIVFQKN